MSQLSLWGACAGLAFGRSGFGKGGFLRRDADGGIALTGVRTIGIVGSGPTAIYVVKYLITHDQPLDITVFEASAQAGLGMPYNPDMNADYMLCNAFSREIPAPVTPPIDWLKHRE